MLCPPPHTDIHKGPSQHLAQNRCWKMLLHVVVAMVMAIRVFLGVILYGKKGKCAEKMNR